MTQINLSPTDYREAGSTTFVMRRGWRKWLYFARHPVLAFVTYQKAYPDSPEVAAAFRAQMLNAVAHGVGTYFTRHLTGH